MTSTIDKRKIWSSFALSILPLLLFFIVAWWFWARLYPAHLHNMEQSQMFLFSCDYFRDTVSQPAGLALYIGRFLAQFFYSDMLGPVIMALLLTLLGVATQLLQRGRDLVSLSISFLPPIALWAYLIDAETLLVMPVAVVIVFFAVYLGEKISCDSIAEKGESRAVLYIIMYGYVFLMTIALFYAVGGIFCLFPLAFLGRRAMRFVAIKKYAKGVIAVVAALLLWLLPVMLLADGYEYPRDVIVWGLNYSRYILYPSPYCTTVWWVSLASVLLLAFRFPSSRIGKVAGGGLLIVVVISGILVIRSLVEPEEESLFQYMNLVREKRYDDIIAKSRKTVPANTFELSSVNFAQAMRGVLCDELFNYPQKGTEGLLPTYLMDRMTPLFTADALYQMGMVNQAMRYFFECNESQPDYQKSARCTEKLVATNLIVGRVEVAREYNEKLKKTIYYRTKALKMDRLINDTSLISADPELGVVRRRMFDTDLLFNDKYLGLMSGELVNDHPDNMLAWQYFFAHCLLTKDLQTLCQAASVYTSVGPKMPLPMNVQEAVIMAWTMSNGSPEGCPWAINKNVMRRFVEFAQVANQQRSKAEPIVKKEFGNTFWCYYLLGGNQEGDSETSLSPHTHVPNATTGASLQERVLSADGTTGASQQVAPSRENR